MYSLLIDYNNRVACTHSSLIITHMAVVPGSACFPLLSVAFEHLDVVVDSCEHYSVEE